MISEHYVMKKIKICLLHFRSVFLNLGLFLMIFGYSLMDNFNTCLVISRKCLGAFGIYCYCCGIDVS